LLRFSKLVINEWLKLYKKRSFIIAYAIMALLAIGTSILVWKFSDAGEFPTVSKFVEDLISQMGIGILYTIVAMIFTAGIVSKEFQLGSVKLLLIRSHTRTKILASKYVAMLIYLVALMIFTIAIGSIMGAIMFGVKGEMAWGEVFKTAAFQLLYTAIYSTLMFMFSVLTRSTGATIGIGMGLIMVEGIISMLLSRYEFAKYILFLNMNLSMYSSGGTPPIEGMTFGFSSLIIAVYMAVFIAVSFLVFKKRDVA